MARKIVITSGKGGVGKTTFCAMVGYFLASLGARVCVLDLDSQLNNLDVALNVQNKIVFDIVDVAEGKCRTTQAIIQHESGVSLFILPTSQSFLKNNITLDKLKKIVSVLDEAFEFVLLDCPAGIDDGFYKAVSLADEAIIVATPHIFALRDASKVVRILLNKQMPPPKVVINRLRTDLVLSGEMLDANGCAKLINAEVLGVVCESDKVQTSTSLDVFSLDERAKKCFLQIAKNILTGHIILPDLTKKRSLFCSFFKRKKSFKKKSHI